MGKGKGEGEKLLRRLPRTAAAEPLIGRSRVRPSASGPATVQHTILAGTSKIHFAPGILSDPLMLLDIYGMPTYILRTSWLGASNWFKDVVICGIP